MLGVRRGGVVSLAVAVLACLVAGCGSSSLPHVMSVMNNTSSTVTVTESTGMSGESAQQAARRLSTRGCGPDMAGCPMILAKHVLAPGKSVDISIPKDLTVAVTRALIVTGHGRQARCMPVVPYNPNLSSVPTFAVSGLPTMC